MSKKTKKKQKKQDKNRSSGKLDVQSESSALKQRIKKLEKELDKRDRLIESLHEKVKKAGSGKGKKGKAAKQDSKSLFKQQTHGVSVMQKQAWQRHGYLRHRYEYYLSVEQDKRKARNLAGQDLRDKFGEDAGYTEEELENILS